jgi:hypothetical protein
MNIQELLMILSNRITETEKKIEAASHKGNVVAENIFKKELREAQDLHAQVVKASQLPEVKERLEEKLVDYLGPFFLNEDRGKQIISLALQEVF